MSASDFTVTMVDVDQIGRHPKARQINDDRLADLEESIGRIGLKNPIHVRRAFDENGHALWDRYQIVAGHHRFAACGLLGWREVPCFVGTQDDIVAEMEMIAENLHRAELRMLERDEQIARWIELCEQQPIERGADDGPIASPPTDNPDHEGFLSQPATKFERGRPEGGVRAAARDLGVAKDDAYRAVKVASLSPEAKVVAREMGLDDNRTALLDAAKHDTPDAQVKALQERRQGGVAGRIEPEPGPTYEQMRAAILLLAAMTANDIKRLCPRNKRAAMCQKLAHLEQVFEQVREAASA